DKIHRAGRRGILSNGKRDRGSLSSFFSFRLVSLVSSFAKEETREMRQRNPNANESSKTIWFSETPPFSFSFTMKRRSRFHSKTSGRPMVAPTL
ncbi:MAG: hypothetical protein IJC32_01150, partial [Clostridia bacterium]|nr:hypothetical protein [Clostridia bacterium]